MGRAVWVKVETTGHHGIPSWLVLITGRVYSQDYWRGEDMLTYQLELGLWLGAGGENKSSWNSELTGPNHR